MAAIQAEDPHALDGRPFALWCTESANLIGEYDRLSDALAAIGQAPIGHDVALVFFDGDDEHLLMGPEEARSHQPAYVISGNTIAGDVSGGIQTSSNAFVQTRPADRCLIETRRIAWRKAEARSRSGASRSMRRTASSR